jgi:hypothetical protein
MHASIAANRWDSWDRWDLCGAVRSFIGESQGIRRRHAIQSSTSRISSLLAPGFWLLTPRFSKHRPLQV